MASFSQALGFLVTVLFLIPVAARGDGRMGSIEWSDGRKLTGELSLTPGKDLRLFVPTGQVSAQLAEVKEMRFTAEKEEMREGFYFPDAGQATQAKTGEVYPVRYLRTQITLADGKVLTGHLFTTTLYVETDDATEKVVLMAKQTGTDGQKLTDVPYPTLVRFDTEGTSGGSSQIDLTRATFAPTHPPVIVAKPDLSVVAAEQVMGKPLWTVPVKDPGQLLFAVEAAEEIHVAWPVGTMAQAYDPVQHAVQTSLKEMQDFYDTRTLLGNFAETDDVYSLVMLERLGPTNGFSAERKPWSLVVLRWKYDSGTGKTTLLNRVSLAMGRAEGNSPLPAVLKEPELLHAISVLPDSLQKKTIP